MIHQPPSTGIESQNVVNQTPHSWVQESRWLAEYCSQIITGPFKETAITGNAECHVRLHDGNGGITLQETEEIWVCAWVEDNLGNLCRHEIPDVEKRKDVRIPLERRLGQKFKIPKSPGISKARTYRHRLLHIFLPFRAARI
jgi:hypothetical protein